MHKFTQSVSKALSALLTFFIIAFQANSATISSSATGTWATPASWAGGIVPGITDTVIISSGDNISVGANTTIKKLTVNNGGYLTLLSGKTLTVSGSDLTINGLINGAGALSLNTASGVLSGTGSIENTGTFRVMQSLSIPSNATLIKSGSGITINNNVVITNNGSLTVYGAINGTTGATNAEFVNASNAYLSLTSSLMNIGILNASAVGNTIDFSGSATVTLKTTTYYHVSLTGSGSKRLGGVIDVLGNLTSSAPFSCQNNNFTIAGDLTMSNTFTYGTGTVTFNGSSNQTLNATVSGAQSFYNLVVSKPTGVLTVLSNITARFALTMNSGNINNTGYKLTLGTASTNATTRGTLNYTSGTVVGAFERWFATTNTASDFLFPVGTLTDYRPATVNFTTITTAGRLSYSFTTTPPSNTGLPTTSGGVTSYNNFNDGQWNATGLSLVSSNYKITLDANGFSAFAINGNSRVLTNSGSAWAANGTHDTQIGSFLSRTGISGVTAAFAIASDNNCTLPALATITGTQLPCKNSTVAYSIPNNVGSTYQWTLPAGASFSGASNTNSVNVIFGATTGTSTISVKETSACGQGPLATSTLNVGPVQPAKIIGSVKVAEGDEGVEYSVDSVAGYSYTWSVSGATIVSGQSKGKIKLNFGVQGVATLDVITLGCSEFAPTVSKTINIAKVLVSTDSIGNIDNPAVFQGAIVTSTANIMIDSAAVITVPLASTVTSVANLNISNGGTFTLERNFTVSGNLVVDGVLNTNGFSLVLSGADKTITGNGTINGTGIISITGGNKTITSDAVIVIPGNLSVDANSITVTNNGSVTIQGDLTRSASSASRVWTNATNSVLNVTGNVVLNTLNTGSNSTITVGGNMASTTTTGTSTALTVGGNLTGTTITGASSTTNVTGTTGTITAGASSTLSLTGAVTTVTAGVSSIVNLTSTIGTCNCTATGNTVNYIGTSQAVKGTTYHHINLSGTGLATLGGNITVNGDLNLNNTASVDAAARTLTLKGNFISTSSATTPFVASTSTLSFTGTTEQNLNFTSTPTFNNITVNKASEDLKIGGNIKVASTLTMTLGDINLNSYNIDLETTGTLASEKETSRIKGNTGSITAVRTVGQGVTSLNVAGLGAILTTPNNAANNLGSVSVIRSHSSFGSGNNATPNRSYDVTPSLNTGLSTTLRLSYLTSEIPVGAVTPVNIYRSTNGATNFAAPEAGTVSTGTNFVQLTGITSFSKWVPGGATPPSNPLPVELSHFAASREQNLIPIVWTTTMERNNQEFVIEKSTDGTNFEAVASIAGVGNTNNVTNYNYNLLNAPEAAVFFRLKQVDFDGQYAYSKIIAVSPSTELGNVNESEFSIFPNPVTSNEIFLKFVYVPKETVVVKIFDASEKVHYTEEIDVEGDGVTKLYLVPSQTLSKGVYFTTIKTSTKLHTIKLIIE